MDDGMQMQCRATEQADERNPNTLLVAANKVFVESQLVQ